MLAERLRGEGVDMSAPAPGSGLEGSGVDGATDSPPAGVLRNVVGRLPIREQKRAVSANTSYGTSSSSALAAEAAALAAQRKQDPSNSPFGPRVKLRSPSSRVTSAQKPPDTSPPPDIPAKAEQRKASGVRSPSSPDPIADEASLDDTGVHNTSAATALPPLSLPKNGRKSTADDVVESATMPAEPPPSAAEHDVSTGGVIDDADPASSAGPASKSGLEAVTSDPEKLSAAGGDTTHHRGSELTTASEEEIKHVESQSSIAEEPEAEDAHAKELEKEQHVTFQEDKLKGEPGNGYGAEESVGD